LTNDTILSTDGECGRQCCKDHFFSQAAGQPTRQESACDGIRSQTDKDVGYEVENAEDHTAKTVSPTVAKVRPRQLAGEGFNYDIVLSKTDNGRDYGVEKAEENSLDCGSIPSLIGQDLQRYWRYW